MEKFKNVDGKIQLINKEDFNRNNHTGVTKNNVTVKNNSNEIFNVSIDDPRYLSGELVPIWKNRKHSNETIEKMKKSKNTGEKNSQFGTIWISHDDRKDTIKIKKEDFKKWEKEGWRKGRIFLQITENITRKYKRK